MRIGMREAERLSCFDDGAGAGSGAFRATATGCGFTVFSGARFAAGFALAAGALATAADLVVVFFPGFFNVVFATVTARSFQMTTGAGQTRQDMPKGLETHQ